MIPNQHQRHMMEPSPPIRSITFPSSVQLVIETHLRHHFYDQSHACDLPTHNVEPALLSREIHHHLPRLVLWMYCTLLHNYLYMKQSLNPVLIRCLVTVNDESNYMSGYLSAMHHAHIAPETWSLDLALPMFCLIILSILLICLYRRRHAKRREE